MNKIKTLLVDDEKISLITLKTLINTHFSEIEVVGMAGSVADAIDKINQLNPELVFLDISLPDGEGFDVLKGTPAKSFETIFTTAHEKFALKAFDFFAIHYLVKPVTLERLHDAIARFHEVRKKDELSQQILNNDQKDVSELICQGESSRLEFKSSLRWDYYESKANKKLEEVILKSIAAFSNAKGGVLIIGVKDDGQILGLERDYSTLKQPNKDQFELHLRSLIMSGYGVPFATNNVTISFPVIGGHEICMIEIKKGDEPLYTTVSDKTGAQVEKFFVRTGNLSQEVVKPSRIMDYIKCRF